MRRKQYTDCFEKFWVSLENYFPKGSKPEAFKEFQRLECDDKDAEFIAARYNQAVNAKRTIIEGGNWSAPLKHVCRYLKHEEFDNEIYEPVARQSSKDSERRDQYAQFFGGTEASMGESLGDVGGKSISNGAGNIIDFPVLDESNN